MDITLIEKQLAELYTYLPILKELKKGYEEHQASLAAREARDREEEQAHIAAEDEKRKASEAAAYEVARTDLRASLAAIGISDREGNGPYGPLRGDENKEELADMLTQAVAHGIKKPDASTLETDDEYRVRVLAAVNKRDKEEVSQASGAALDTWGTNHNLARLGKPTDKDS